MYNNNSREYNYKPRRHSKNKPSFSSTLLDKIYRSIDANADDFNPKKEAQNGFSRFVKTTCSTDDEDHDKFTAKRRPTLFPEDNDFLFFSSTTSASSDSSGALSSSDTEFFGRVSCLSSQTRPKPIRTGLLENQAKKCEDDTIKLKSRASKIYANFRKVKQPISPGGRLTSFLNSLFHSTNGKKGKNLDPADCSSVTSFSRSCLSKCPLDKPRNGNGRTVRFNPLSVVVDEDSRARGHKSVCREISDKCRRPPLPLPESKSSVRDIKHIDQGKARDALSLRGFNSQRKDQSSVFTKTRREEEGIDCDEDEDGSLSDSSSDLFELDNLNVFGNERFCEELPVYETTRFDSTKRASVTRLIR
ncbi:protein BIG GRAIN 1-like B [Primulina tabacum]|uniref:protein BIG GRAIN 1-like B n=1 Tax=Primulina tabacum TaxID=48773 RepID=UPI003F59F743